jgi:hypothetical protein
VAWLIDPDGTRWLSKPASSGRTAGRERTGPRRSLRELATLVKLPAARFELATRMTEPGCISRDLRPGAQWEMQSGAVLISEISSHI